MQTDKCKKIIEKGSSTILQNWRASGQQSADIAWLMLLNDTITANVFTWPSPNASQSNFATCSKISHIWKDASKNSEVLP